jgi:hypothetical protein
VTESESNLESGLHVNLYVLSAGLIFTFTLDGVCHLIIVSMSEVESFLRKKRKCQKTVTEDIRKELEISRVGFGYHPIGTSQRICILAQSRNCYVFVCGIYNILGICLHQENLL